MVSTGVISDVFALSVVSSLLKKKRMKKKRKKKNMVAGITMMHSDMANLRG